MTRSGWFPKRLGFVARTGEGSASTGLRPDFLPHSTNAAGTMMSSSPKNTSQAITGSFRRKFRNSIHDSPYATRRVCCVCVRRPDGRPKEEIAPVATHRTEERLLSARLFGPRYLASRNIPPALMRIRTLE